MHLQLDFGTERGTNRQIRVPHVPNNLDADDVLDAMNMIIESQAFEITRRPQTIRGASIVTVHRESFNV